MMINLNKPIYDVYLVSVCSNAMIDMGKSVDENMKRALLNSETNLLAKVLVQSTFKSDEFKEIVTGKIIPGCIIYTDDIYKKLIEWNFSNRKINSYVLIKPIYLKFFSHKYVGYKRDLYDRYLSKVTYDRLDEYLNNHLNKEVYLQELDEIFERAKDNYYQAADKVIINDKYKIKKLIKDYNNKWGMNNE